jgi:hypothetical protein
LGEKPKQKALKFSVLFVFLTEQFIIARCLFKTLRPGNGARQFDGVGQCQLEGKFSLWLNQRAKRGKCPFFERDTVYSCNNRVINKPRKKAPVNA